jgi:hypothetical protein
MRAKLIDELTKGIALLVDLLGDRRKYPVGDPRL